MIPVAATLSIMSSFSLPSAASTLVAVEEKTDDVKAGFDRPADLVEREPSQVVAAG